MGERGEERGEKKRFGGVKVIVGLGGWKDWVGGGGERKGVGWGFGG